MSRSTAVSGILYFALISIFFFFFFSNASASAAKDLILIDLSAQKILETNDIPVVWKGTSLLLARWDQEQQEQAQKLSISFRVLAQQPDATHEFYLAEEQEILPESAVILVRAAGAAVVLLRKATATTWIEQGHKLIAVPQVSRGWEKVSAPLVPFNCLFNSVTADLLSRTNQPQWIDWIEKVSGVEPVTIGGTDYTIATRYSSTMFSNVPHAKGYDFALQQAQSFNYPPAQIEEDPYSGSGGATWKNLILTIPGQISPNEVVLITGHYDSTSNAPTTLAPGANDNATGSATLFEAARLLRQFRFQRTIKMIWFTGEEQGLWGSEAYVADHNTSNYLGVVNMDMFGWDSDFDRCFEIHAGTLPQSQDVGNCFHSSIGSYSLGLSDDFLTFGATSASDHASFWQVGVGAIEIAENYFNNNLPGGCVGNDPNPHYHTTNDTLSQNVTPSYTYDIARTGLATIAAMAIPINACFNLAPVLTATPANQSVDLSWTAVTGANAYRVYRGTKGCQGQWFEIGETAATNMIDDTANENLLYSYYVEAVALDGFCVSAMSNCEQVTPVIYQASVSNVSYQDTCASGGPGNGNGIVEPGESVVMPVTLLNSGNQQLTGISGTLSTVTAGVAVTDSNATWPDLAPGSSSGSDPDHLAFTVSDSLACGTVIDFALDVTYSGASNTASIPTATGSTVESLLLNTTFSGSFPGTWTVVNGGSGGGSAATWTNTNPAGRVIGSPFSSPFAIVDSDFAGASAFQDEQLITPTLNATGCGQLTIEFSNQLRWFSGGLNEIADVDVSTNGGTVWTNVLRMQGGSDGYPTPNTKNLDLTAAIQSNPANVKVRFHYYQAQDEYWWAIDNVRVRCFTPVCNLCLAPPPDFAISVSPSTFDIAQGSSGGGITTVTSLNGFNSGVTLGCSGAPAGVSCQFTPAAVTPPADGTADSALTLSVAGSVAPGIYAFDVTGNDGVSNHNFPIQLNVSAAPDFQFDCSASSLILEQDSSQEITCTITSVNGFSSPVTLSCPTAPSGITCSFLPNPVTPPADGNAISTATIAVDATAAPAAYNFSIDASDGSLTHPKNIAVTVVSSCLFCDDFEDGILASDWTYLKPSWTESSGQLIGQPSGRKAVAVAAPVFAGCTLCSVAAELQTNGGPFNKVWLLGWYIDKKNTIEVLMKEENDRFVLKQRMNGAVIAKAKAFVTIEPGINYQVEVRYDGSAFQLFVNGTLRVIMPAVSSPGSGTVGFQVKNTIGRFGYIEVN